MAADLESLHLPRLDLGVFKSTCRYLERIGKPTIPFQPPVWALPPTRKPAAVALVDVFKLNEVIASVNVDTKATFVFGRNALVCDIVLEHCSISRMHACLVHHVDGSVYIVDLGSCHGTFMDAEKLEPLRPTLLTHGAHLRFGVSSRSYRFKTYESKAQILKRLRDTVGLHDEERMLQTNTLLNRFLSYRLDVAMSPTDVPIIIHRPDPAASTNSSRVHPQQGPGRVASNSTDTNDDATMDEDPTSNASSNASSRHSSSAARLSGEAADAFAMVDIDHPLLVASRKRSRPPSTDRAGQVFLTFDLKRVRFVPDPPTVIPYPYDEDGHRIGEPHDVHDDDVAMDCEDDDVPLAGDAVTPGHAFHHGGVPFLNYGPMGDTPMDEYMMENPFATVAPGADAGRCGAMPLSLQFPLHSDRPSLDVGGRRRSTIG